MRKRPRVLRSREECAAIHLSAIGAFVPVAFLMPLCKERRLKDEKLFRF